MTKALFHYQLNVGNFARSLAFYKSLGMVEETGWYPKHDSKVTSTSGVVYKALGTDGQARRIVMLRFPEDPFGHIQLHDWEDKADNAEGRLPFNALGIVRTVFRVKSLDAKLQMLKAYQIQVLCETETMNLKWGATRCALVRDPDGNLIELIEISSSQSPESALFELHLNVSDFKKSVDFFRVLGMQETHDSAPGENFKAPDLSQMYQVFGFNPTGNQITMMKLPSDPAGYFNLHDWGARGIKSNKARKFNQLGVCRIDFLVDDLDAEIAILKKNGIPLLVDTQTIPHLRWGTTRFVMFCDPDGNLFEYTEISGGYKPPPAE